MKTTTLVLGGGVGGLVAATELRKKLPREHRVVLVERQQEHLFAPSLLWLMVGKRSPEALKRPLARLQRHGIETVFAGIEAIDPEKRRVTLGGTAIDADHIVVSLGASLAPDEVPGLAEAGHNLYSLEGAQGIRDAFARLNAGRVVVLTAEPVYKCPAAPYEAALLLEAEARRRGVRERIQFDVFAAEPGPMGVTGPENSAMVRKIVEGKGIRYHPEHQVQSVDPKTRRITFLNGVEATFDFLVYVPPHRAPKVVRDAGLVGTSGWVDVDRRTMETRLPGVYAIGDVTGIPLKMGKPLPKAGTFAHRQAEVVARNIAHKVTGKGQPAAFDGHGSCFLEIGDGRAGFGSGDFYAEPTPQVRLRRPGRTWHWGKVLFEKYWLWRWF